MDIKERSVLRNARRKKGFTQSSLGEALGVEPQTVSAWERGLHEPSPKLQRHLADLLGMPWDVLDGQVPDGRREAEDEARDETEDNPEEPGRVWETYPTPRGDINRFRILHRIRSRWISGVLDHLASAPLIPLRFQVQPNAIESPWQTSQDIAPSMVYLLPEETRIIDIYDDASGELLILGEAGAGKSTLLLALTKTLVERALQHDELAIPVIFNLASWAEKQLNFDDWLAQELHVKYQVPQALAQDWIAHDRIVLLLDGLDEVESHVRSACVSAINAYRQHDHGLVSIVLCCRTNEYDLLPEHVVLSRAVKVQPLTGQEIDQYVARHGKHLQSVQVALQHMPQLRELCTTPLLLSMVLSTYYGEEVQHLQSDEFDEEKVFEHYVERLLQRRPTDRYDALQVKAWLGWLAWQIRQHNQVEFFVERMQPDWLPSARYAGYRSMVIRVFYGIQCLAVTALYAWLRGGKVTGSATFGVGAGLFGLFGSGPGNTIFGWMSSGLGGGLEAGGSLGIIIALLFSLITVLAQDSSPTLSWQAMKHGLLRGIRNGAIVGLPTGFLALLIFLSRGGLIHGLVYGAGAGLFCGLTAGLLSGLLSGIRYHVAKTIQEKEEGRRTIWERCGDTLAIGLAAGLGFACVDMVEHIALSSIIIYSSIAGFFGGIFFGLGGGITFFPHLGESIQPAEIASWSWTQAFEGVRVSVKNGLFVAFSVFVCAGSAIALISGFFYGVTYGARFGLVYGIICGSIAAIAAILASVLKHGWSSQLLEDNEILQPNEGIRRSAKNALFAACVFGPLSGITSGLIAGVSFGVIGRLPQWPVLAAGFAIVFGIIFALQFGCIHGGIAVLEHYLLRWSLWRLDEIPLNYVQFLDDAAERVLLRKVGGSYMFPHRMIMDYLAHWYVQHKLNLVETKKPEGADRDGDREE